MLNIRIDLAGRLETRVGPGSDFLMCLVLLQRVLRLLNRYLIRMEHWELVAPLKFLFSRTLMALLLRVVITPGIQM